jgi:uncharacterized membrane protein
MSEPTETSAARPSSSQVSNREAKFAQAASAFVVWIARHWLALFNGAWALYVGLPFLAPVLLYLGLDTPARVIYAFYSVLCHQLPDHSYFLFGPQLVPDMATLVANGMSGVDNLFLQRQFVGNEAIGFKVAICQRDVSIYASVLAAGLLFGLVRQRLPELKLRWYLLLVLPIVLDGGTQLFGWRESTWLLRTLTGALFGASSVWLAYPFIDDAMQDVVRTEGPRAQLT